MRPRIHIVGSGASGVHFAQSLLERGYAVTMIDVGRQAPPMAAPDASLNGLKDTLPDPAAYFLGRDFDSVLLPGTPGEYYGLPPSKDYVFDSVDGFASTGTGFDPLYSFARGGLAEAWTGGCYPLNDAELDAFPFGYAEIGPHYSEVAGRIGVSGDVDDLSRFFPVHDHLLPGLRLDAHSETLMAAYGRERARLNAQGVFVGRTRVATLTQARDGREACTYSGRCLWGCPRRAIYTPSQTLARLRAFPDFEYLDGLEVRHLVVGAGRRIQAVVARPVGGGAMVTIACDRLALAAGALLSTRIFLSTHAEETGTRVALPGLMDNRQVLVPFLNLGLLGRPFSADTYQYHMLGMGLDTGDGRTYVHGQITTLKTALLHPIIQRLPFDLGASTAMMRAVHGALGLVNLNFHDSRRDENTVALDAAGNLVLRYAAPADEPGRIAASLTRVRRALWRLNCVVPPGMVHVRPMGASVHYAGTLPMTTTAAPFTTDVACTSRDYPNLHIVDGATFPFLPAKNLTFTLMANAARAAALVAA
ncbi:MAG: GMC oxidoreductase [Vicinamibacterales bacterium]